MAGLYFEGFKIGQIFKHSITRTITEADNVFFSALTHNPQPLHIDRHYCETQTEWGEPLINSFLTLAMTVGISINDTTLGTTIANLGVSDARFVKPLFHGDTIHVESEIINKRESCSRPNAGIVEFEHRTYNETI